MKAARKNRKGSPPKQTTLLQQLASMPDKLFNGGFRTQYGALCFRQLPEAGDVQVLLVTTRNTGRWVIPKGWPMKKKKPYEAAEIEAWEEAGVKGRARKKPVGRYTYLKWLDNGDVAPCVVDVFQVEVSDVVANFKERGQREVAWFSPEEAARRVREVELKSLLVEFQPKGK
ncbi:NUDIX hydrolase [Agrobacterium sp.]|jgi:8-oxo-dGTP pyrophosphatase MutT (NUDIX family)|uniref:NUDIX hydrolase n=1 Tax=Agrobacterium sp. TaxID=361 RepID=UPI0028A63357|nr:NUDIX hydrolase [Agrobacterium sp.]